MIGILPFLLALVGLSLGQPWEYGYPCAIANCASHCIPNATENGVPCGGSFDWKCLCYSDTFLHYFEWCATYNCPKLEYSGSFCEVAKSCSSVGAPMTFGPYSTAVTIDDPRTYPTFGTDGALITARSASLTITDSVAPAGSQSVVEATTVTTIWTSAITLEIDHQGSVVSTLSSNDIVSATSTEPSTSSSMPASSNMSAEPVLSFPGAYSTTSATPQQSAMPLSNGPSPDLAASAAFANSSTASPAVFANQTTLGLTNTTSAELSASNSSTSTAPTLSKSPHKSSPSPNITSMSPATGLITEPDANDAADGERSTVDTTKTMPLSAMSTAYTTTAGAAVDADLVYGVALGALIVFGVFMLGL